MLVKMNFLKYYTYLCCHLLSVQTVYLIYSFLKMKNSAEDWPNKNLIREVSVWLLVAGNAAGQQGGPGRGRRGGGGEVVTREE